MPRWKNRKFPLTINNFTEKGYLIDKIKLLFQKGVFLYDWTNTWEKFDRTSLPPRKDFYSILSQQNISKGIMNMRKKYGKNLRCRALETIMTFISKLMCFYLLIYL